MPHIQEKEKVLRPSRGWHDNLEGLQKDQEENSRSAVKQICCLVILIQVQDNVTYPAREGGFYFITLSII